MPKGKASTTTTNPTSGRKIDRNQIAITMSELEFSPSTLEVDYDKNLTELYRAITDQDWETAVRVCKQDPDQAATWVVRHYEPENEEVRGEDEDLEIMWRFLPLHSACARQPPSAVVTALLHAYPDGAKCQDDQGMYALHYACGNQASRDVIRLLLVSFPEAAQMVDPRGMLPIHYLACWGPSSIAVVDMLLVANRDVAQVRDMDGNTPMDLAREGDYPEREAVITALRKWNNNRSNGGHGNESTSMVSGNRSQSTKRSSQSKASGRTSSSKTTTKSRKSTSSRSRPIQRKNTDDSMNSTQRSGGSGTNHEEKKDDPIVVEDIHRLVAGEVAGIANRGALKPAISPDEVKRMQEEIRSLKSERIGMSKRLSEANSKVTELEEANKKIQEQDKIIEQLRNELSTGEESAVSSTNIYAKELEETKAKLKDAKSELKGLRLSLTDMMEQHQSQKKKSGNMNDRLASLVYSLESMMERQSSLERSVKDRREKRQKALRERKEALKKLLELDDASDDEEQSLESSFKKQTKEMEAIAAVINAARD